MATDTTITEAPTTPLARGAAEPAAPPGRLLDGGSERSRKQARERRRSLARRMRQGLLAALLLGAAVAAVLALRPRPVQVDLARAARGPLVVAIEEDGVTRVRDRYVVSAPLAGFVSRLPQDPGDPVREGDTLARIAPTLSPLLDERTRTSAEARLRAALSALGQAQAQRSRASAARELAERELQRVRKLFEASSVTRQALDQAELEAKMRGEDHSSAGFAEKVATEEVRIARATLGREGAASARRGEVAVRAPVSGRVLRVNQKSAGVVMAGAPLLEVGDPEALEVVVDLLTTDAVHIAPGTPVVLQRWGGEQPLAGRVRRIEPSAFTRPSALGVDEQRVNVIIAFTEARERWATLGDGYRVEARLVLWQGSDVLKVPQGAVFRRGADWAVFRVGDGVARLVPVQIGHRGEAEVEIVQGLAAGDAVAVHPGDRVKDGVRVEAR